MVIVFICLKLIKVEANRIVLERHIIAFNLFDDCLWLYQYDHIKIRSKCPYHFMCVLWTCLTANELHADITRKNVQIMSCKCDINFHPKSNYSCLCVCKYLQLDKIHNDCNVNIPVDMFTLTNEPFILPSKV